MLGRMVLAFVVCSKILTGFAQDQKSQEYLPQDISEKYPLASLLVTHMFQLDELAKPYCQKHTDVLPIWCSNCKKRKLYLGEFSSCLVVKAIKEIASGKNPEKTKIACDNFVKLLAAPDTQEVAMVEFVLKELEGIEYRCTHCEKASWVKMPQAGSSVKGLLLPIEFLDKEKHIIAIRTVCADDFDDIKKLAVITFGLIIQPGRCTCIIA